MATQTKEEILIEKIEEVVSNGTIASHPELFEKLTKEYKKLYKQLNRVVRISDKQQAEVTKKNDMLANISSRLSKYLSPQIYESIFLGKQDASLSTSRKKLTIFFSDIENFTSTTEGMEPEKLTLFLNEYLHEMFEIALKHGATIDKFIGDAILVFFGDPESKGEKEDALACVSMALEMRQRIESLSKEWLNRGVSEPFKVRMGISSGYVNVGNFGSDHRMDYTIIGGQVNLASRLEATAHANEILISHETYSHIKDKIFCEQKDTIFVKGIPYPIPTYQVINHFENIKQKDEINLVSDAFSFYLDKDKMKQAKTQEELKVLINELTLLLPD
jgi:class 3 adenylate cyclase